MSILNISSSRPVPETELESITQLAVALSGTLPPKSNAHLAAATEQVSV